MPEREFVDTRNDPRQEGRFFGKYRGIVTDNKDPEKIGRIQATVPAVSAMSQSWALPCAPYAGDDVGFYAIPPIGAMVWIEFEGGNPDFPIWTGCFWQKKIPAEVATNAGDPSQVKVFKTRVMTFWIDDTDKKGQVVLQFNDPSVDSPVTVKLHLDSTGLTLTVAGKEDTSTITQTPPWIDTDSRTLTTSTEDTTFTAQKNLTANVTGDMTLKADGNAVMQAANDVTIQGANGTFKADVSLDLTATGAATLKSSAVTVQGGATATLKAGATAIIRGALVEIN